MTTCVKMVLKEIINKGSITMNQFHSNTIETSRKTGKHLTLDERGIIQALHQQGHSLRYIATIVGCAHTTIYNEIRRGTPKPKNNRGRRPQYTAKSGQKAYEEHRKHSRKPLKIYCDDCEPFINWMVTQVREKRWSMYRRLLSVSHIANGTVRISV